LGNSGITNIVATAGGVSFEQDIVIIGFHGWMRSSGTNTKDTRVRIVRQQKQEVVANRVTTEMYTQSNLITGLSSNTYRLVDLDFTTTATEAQRTLPAGETLVFGLDTPNSTTGTAGRRAQCSDCYILAVRKRNL
ncbi:MAG: hypothetical protein AAF738_10335, partial [Bacteroidota bacterium]